MNPLTNPENITQSFQEQHPHHKPIKIIIIIILLTLGLTVGIVAYQTIQNSNRDVSTFSSDDTSDWQTYRNEEYGFEFMYPQNLTLEEREKNYLVLLTDPNDPTSVLVSIDARLEGAYSNYETAIEKTNEGLTNIIATEMDTGIRISGIVGPGYGDGIPITQVFIKYKEGTIEAETTTTDPAQLQLFDQILSTFHLTD